MKYLYDLYFCIIVCFHIWCRQALFQQFKDNEIPLFEMSTLTGEGVMEARTEV